MKCAWEELLKILPPRIRIQVDKLGKEKMEELHMRLQQSIELILAGQSQFLNTRSTAEDLAYVVNTASRYSPWAASTAAQGYITAPGGHRIGLCGDCAIQAGNICAIRTPTSLCIRVAREFPGIGKGLPMCGSLLILGPPGVGKTTLLRDLIRLRSENGQAVSVVDERSELFPLGDHFTAGPRTDVLTGCSRAQGIMLVLRSMSPKCIAVDEITAEEDCLAMLKAGWCGVSLLATAHASDYDDLRRRGIYQPLVKSGLFTQAVILRQDKSWRMERMALCT